MNSANLLDEAKVICIDADPEMGNLADEWWHEELPEGISTVALVALQITKFRDEKEQQLQQEYKSKHQQLQQENKSKHQQLQQENKLKHRKKSLVSIVDTPLNFIDQTDSEPHQVLSDTHSPAKKNMSFIELKSTEDTSEILKSDFVHPEEKGFVSVQSEADIASFCSILLKSITKVIGLKVQKEIGVHLSRYVSGTECDIVLVSGPNKMPFGVIEVKKPGFQALHYENQEHLKIHTGDFEYYYRGEHEKRTFSGYQDEEGQSEGSGLTLGQNMDQLQCLEFGGYSKMYGMITNGNTWVMTQNNGGRSFSELPEEEQSVSNAHQSFNKNNISPEVKVPLEEEKEESEVRCLTTSQPVSITTSPEQCIYLISEFIYRALERLKHPTYVFSGVIVSCRKLFVIGICKGQADNLEGNNLNKFTFNKMKVKKYDLESRIEFSTTSGKTIHVFRYIGSGQHGEVCLAMNDEGNAFCAVKFFKKVDELTNYAEQEYEKWIRFYPELKKYLNFGSFLDGSCYLVMPYLKPIPSNKRKDYLINNRTGGCAMKEALEYLVNKGVVFKLGMQWRHVGTLDGKVYFLDFGADGIERAPASCQEKKAWVEENLETLKMRSGEQLSNPSSPNLSETHTLAGNENAHSPARGKHNFSTDASQSHKAKRRRTSPRFASRN